MAETEFTKSTTLLSKYSTSILDRELLHRTFGGEIMKEDFYMNTSLSEMAKRIENDFSFDEKIKRKHINNTHNTN